MPRIDQAHHQRVARNVCIMPPQVDCFRLWVHIEQMKQKPIIERLLVGVGVLEAKLATGAHGPQRLRYHVALQQC